MYSASQHFGANFQSNYAPKIIDWETLNLMVKTLCTQMIINKNLKARNCEQTCFDGRSTSSYLAINHFVDKPHYYRIFPMTPFSVSCLGCIKIQEDESDISFFEYNASLQTYVMFDENSQIISKLVDCYI